MRELISVYNEKAIFIEMWFPWARFRHGTSLGITSMNFIDGRDRMQKYDPRAITDPDPSFLGLHQLLV